MLRIAHRPAQHFYTSFLMESELYFVSFWRVSSIKSRKTKNKCAFKQEGMILHGGIPFLYIFTNSFQFPLKSLPSLKRERKSHIPREKSQTGNGHNRFQSRSPWTAPLKEEPVRCVLPEAPCRERMISADFQSVPIITGEATLPLRWLSPTTPLWTCRPETPCVASCSRSASSLFTYFQKQTVIV